MIPGIERLGDLIFRDASLHFRILGDPAEECPRLIERFLEPGPDELASRRRFLSLGETRIAGLPPERFGELCWETPSAAELLPRFVQHVF